MMNRNNIFTAVKFLSILLIISINGFAEKPQKSAINSLKPYITEIKSDDTEESKISHSQAISEEETAVSEPEAISSSSRAGEQINWQVLSGGGTEGLPLVPYNGSTSS